MQTKRREREEEKNAKLTKRPAIVAQPDDIIGFRQLRGTASEGPSVLDLDDEADISRGKAAVLVPASMSLSSFFFHSCRTHKQRRDPLPASAPVHGFWRSIVCRGLGDGARL